MKKIVICILLLLMLFSCSSTEELPVMENEEEYASVTVENLDDIRTTISVNGRLCTLTLSAVSGEKSIIVEDGKRYMTYELYELPSTEEGRRYFYSTLGNINIILSSGRIYISIGEDWTETYIERDYLSPFIFATHA